MSPQTTIPLFLAAMSLLSPTIAQAITAAANLRPLLPRQNSDPGSTSCDPWVSIEASCTAQTSNFVNLDFTVQASCLCYSGTAWQPSVFDNDFATCLQHLSTANPSEYSTLGGDSLPTNPCARAGDVVTNTAGGGTATNTLNTANPTALSSDDPNNRACSSLNAIERSCSSTISSFTALPFSVEASCLCYTSSSYVGSIYDDYWGSCLSYISTASPDFYSNTLGGDAVPRTPCANAAIFTATSSAESVINSAGSGATATAPGSIFSQTTTTAPTGTKSNGATALGRNGCLLVMFTGLFALLIF